MTTKKQDKRTYILHMLGGGQRKVTVPARWKATFGNVMPYNSKVTGPAHASSIAGWEYRIALRFYDGSKENLRAVFNDVAYFHDDSVQIEVLKTKPVVTTKQIKSDTGMVDVDINTDHELVWSDERPKKLSEIL